MISFLSILSSLFSNVPSCSEFSSIGSGFPLCSDFSLLSRVLTSIFLSCAIFTVFTYAALLLSLHDSRVDVKDKRISLTNHVEVGVLRNEEDCSNGINNIMMTDLFNQGTKILRALHSASRKVGAVQRTVAERER